MKKKVKYVLISIVVLTALILFTDVYLVFLAPLDTGRDVDSRYGDVILVLGGGLKKGREIGYSTQERLELAVRLFNQKKRTIIISGGSLYKGSPAIKKITDFFEKYGIDQSYLRFEGKSQTTFDNFYYTHEIIENMKFREVIVSTSPYHRRRSRMILSYLGFTDFKIKKMERSEVYQSHSVKQRLRNWKLIVREYMAILKFKVFKR